ncbi:MAG: hypothetical protein QME94_07635 [Anaerolineae bacterium]|nr:hypothetical protein [Anaerolineae bacterium]
MSARHRLALVGMVLLLVAIMLAGSAASPATVRSEVWPQTNCTCVWDAAMQQWCYRCCDVYGCYDLYCDPQGC